MADAGAISHEGGTRPGAVAVWIQAIRAPSLSAAAIPVLLGVAIAARDGFFSFGRMLLALLGAIAIQAGTNAKFGNLATFAPQQCRLTPQPTLQFALRFGPQDFSGAPLARTPVGTTRHCHYPKH